MLLLFVQLLFSSCCPARCALVVGIVDGMMLWMWVWMLNVVAVLILVKVFVLDDGGETDLDLGNYERFMGVNLRNESNLTTGYVHHVTRACHTVMSRRQSNAVAENNTLFRRTLEMYTPLYRKYVVDPVRAYMCGVTFCYDSIGRKISSLAV